MKNTFWIAFVVITFSSLGWADGPGGRRSGGAVEGRERKNEIGSHEALPKSEAISEASKRAIEQAREESPLFHKASPEEVKRRIMEMTQEGRKRTQELPASAGRDLLQSFEKESLGSERNTGDQRRAESASAERAPKTDRDFAEQSKKSAVESLLQREVQEGKITTKAEMDARRKTVEALIEDQIKAVGKSDPKMSPLQAAAIVQQLYLKGAQVQAELVKKLGMLGKEPGEAYKKLLGSFDVADFIKNLSVHRTVPGVKQAMLYLQHLEAVLKTGNADQTTNAVFAAHGYNETMKHAGNQPSPAEISTFINEYNKNPANTTKLPMDMAVGAEAMHAAERFKFVVEAIAEKNLRQRAEAAGQEFNPIDEGVKKAMEAEKAKVAEELKKNGFCDCAREVCPVNFGKAA